MGLYENGLDTRKAILDTCSRLFIEKGYHNSSIDDICREAHVNRGSIYYHFKDKENIRYEVFWNQVLNAIGTVQQLCPDSRCDAMLAMFVLWDSMCRDEGVRRFHIDYFNDYPVYAPHCNLSRAFMVLNDRMYQNTLTVSTGGRLSAAALYGYLSGMVRLSESGEYTPLQLFEQCFVGGNLIRGVPKEEIDFEWRILLSNIRVIDAYLRGNSVTIQS